MQQFATLAQAFPLLLAPAVIAMVRRQKPFKWIDGIVIVWLAVTGAAVLWTILLGMVMGEEIGRTMVARGMLCGLVVSLSHTLATGKGRGLLPAIDPPDPDAPAALSTPADILPRPPVSSAAPTVLTLPDLDFSKDPRPSVRP